MLSTVQGACLKLHLLTVLKISVKVGMPFQIPGKATSSLLEFVCFILFLFTYLYREVFVQFAVVL